MYLGIEIGGTKLQLGVGGGDGAPPVDLARSEVDPRSGARGILDAIERQVHALRTRHHVTRIGIGFGGPVDAATGRVTKSHQIAGWDDYPLADWCQRTLGLPARVDNDCNVAALAEARFGAGRGKRVVFYVTVGTGVGGGLVIDRRTYGADRPAAAEIGHLRPGLLCDRPEATVESLASGWGIVSGVRARLDGTERPAERWWTVTTGDGSPPQNNTDHRSEDDRHDLLRRCDGDLNRMTAEAVAEAAKGGNQVALEVMRVATQALGWAVAQVITLLAPDVVVVGGGVSKVGEELFFDPLTQQVRRYVFPPLKASFHLAPAALEDLVVVHGALALAAEDEAEGSNP